MKHTPSDPKSPELVPLFSQSYSGSKHSSLLVQITQFMMVKVQCLIEVVMHHKKTQCDDSKNQMNSIKVGDKTFMDYGKIVL